MLAEQHPPVPTDSGLAFEVDRILDVRQTSQKRLEYLVRWLGYGPEEDSWEPRKSFIDRAPILDFESKRHSLLPREGAVWRRFQKVGKDHQAEMLLGRAARRASVMKDPEVHCAAAELAEGARQTAALLTAVAYGPVSPLCYVAPADCGLGLFARNEIPVGTPICEYAGPVLPVAWQKQSGYNLGIPGGPGGLGGGENLFSLTARTSRRLSRLESTIARSGLMPTTRARSPTLATCGESLRRDTLIRIHASIEYLPTLVDE